MHAWYTYSYTCFLAVSQSSNFSNQTKRPGFPINSIAQNGSRALLSLFSPAAGAIAQNGSHNGSHALLSFTDLGLYMVCSVYLRLILAHPCFTFSRFIWFPRFTLELLKMVPRHMVSSVCSFGTFLSLQFSSGHPHWVYIWFPRFTLELLKMVLRLCFFSVYMVSSVCSFGTFLSLQFSSGHPHWVYMVSLVYFGIA